MPSKLDPYKEIIDEKLRLCCFHNSIYNFICRKGYRGKYPLYKHREMRSAIFKCEDIFINNILDAIYKRAVGYEIEDEVTIYEIVGDRKK